MTPLILAAVLGATMRPPVAAPPTAPADADLTGRLGGSPREVDASNMQVFAFRWRQPIVRMGFGREVGVSLGRPAVSSRFGLVIVGTGEGRVEGRKLSDGSLVWAYDYTAPFETDVTLVDVPPGKGSPADAAGASVRGHELALAGSRDGFLLAIEAATGKLVWKADVGGDVRAPAAVAGATVVVEAASNRLSALDAATGKILWTGGRPPSTKLTVIGTSRPLIDGDTVYATFSDGYVSALDLADGTVRWSRPLSLKGGEFVDADADPVIVGGRLFVASYSDGLYALNPADGQTVWTRAVPAIVSLGVTDKDVVAGSGDGYVWGFRQATGELAFRTKLLDGLVSRMVVRDGLVVFAGGDSGLVVLDARDGRPVQATDYGGRMVAEPAWVGDSIALVSSSGYLYAFARGSPGRVR